VRANRRFLGRAVRYMAEAGIRQFLDIGTGIPTANNTHEVAQAVAADARVVYVDDDPIVLSHARALLTSTTAPTAHIDADARDTAKILAEAAELLDLSQPTAVMLIAVLHCIPNSDGPYQLVADLMDAVPAGSFLAGPRSGRYSDKSGRIADRVDGPEGDLPHPRAGVTVLHRAGAGGPGRSRHPGLAR
jgi:hypothetical protein